MPEDIYNALDNVPKRFANKVKRYFDRDYPPVTMALLNLYNLLGLSYRLVIDWRKSF
jgi:hypothetical protein